MEAIKNQVYGIKILIVKIKNTVEIKENITL